MSMFDLEAAKESEDPEFKFSSIRFSGDEQKSKLSY